MFDTRDKCPACESANFSELFSAPFNNGAIAVFVERFYQGRLNPQVLAGAPYCICECNRCKLVYQRHILNDTGMAQLYSEWISAEDSLRKRKTGKTKQFRKYAAEAELISRMINKPNHEISVVEFGMGWGYWSRMANAFNFEVIGIELSPQRVQHAASMGVKSVNNIDDIAPASVDFIYTNQVFEHLATPTHILKHLITRLRPNGLVLIRVPDGGGLSRELIANGWSESLQSIHPLEHINAFSRQSLLRLGARLGLQEARAPLRINARSAGNVWRSIVREYRDRSVEPHVFFRKPWALPD